MTDATTRWFRTNRERLLAQDVARRFFDAVVRQAQAAGLLSDEHFSVDGTLIEAWASLKSFQRTTGFPNAPPPDDPGNPTVDFHGERRSNLTHQSTTDPEARLTRHGRGREAKLCFAGHVLMENRHGLCVDLAVTAATGITEPGAAVALLARQARQRRRPTRSGPIRATTRAPSFGTCAPAGSGPMWRRSPGGGRRGSMAARGATRASP